MSIDRTPRQILDLLITAAGTADVLRLSSLIYDARVAEPEATFTRPFLVDAWAARWRHHLYAHGSRRPEQRVNRSLPNLIGVEAVSGLQGPEMRVLDWPMLAFLAERAYMAEAAEIQNPNATSVPVGEVTRARCVELVTASHGPVEPEDPEDGEPSPVATDPADSPAAAVSGQAAG